jgi:uncharacterized membrane protein YeaQ/YmgE (transglycosylase-associated protein family)
MGIVILAIIVIVILAFLGWLTAGLLGLILYLVIAGLVGWLATLIVPARWPLGWIGAIAAGLLGSWLGVWVMGQLGLGGQVGPVVFGVPVIPAFVGALILALIVALLQGAFWRRRRYY